MPAFVADDREVDRAFADSEPPTHHDWVPDSLSERLHKTFVRVALRRIDEKLQEFASLVAEGPSGSALVVPLGAFSELMADLLPGEEGTGAGPVAVGGGVSGGAGGTRGKRAVVNVLGAARLESRDGMRVALFDFEVTHARDSAGTIIEAETSASLDAPGAGTAERDVPAGVPVPEVIEWVAPDGKSQTGARAIEVPIDVEGRWQVAVSVPPDTAVLVKLMATSKDVP